MPHAHAAAGNRPNPAKTRCHPVLRLLLAACLTGTIAGDAAAQLLSTPDRCAAVVPGGPIDYRGTTLLETADIKTPEIRRINALISARCYQDAIEAVERYREAAPDDHQITFVETRLTWIMSGTQEAQDALTPLLAQHPDFASLKVLQASIDIERLQYDKAGRLLDEVAARMPNDLWLLIDRLKIEIQTGPKPGLAEKLQAVVTNPQFPPSAREVMGIELTRLPGVDRAARVAAYRAMLTFESATPYARKASIFSFELVHEDKGTPDDAIDIIGRTLSDLRTASMADELKYRLSIAYLQKAYAVDAKPTARNAGFVDKAIELTGACRMIGNLRYIPDGERYRALLQDKARAAGC